MCVRHWIVDHDKRLRLPRCRQWSDGGQRHFLANTSLAVAEYVRLGLAQNVIPVREGSRRFGNSDSAERRARHNFSAVHSLEAQQFNPLAHRRTHELPAGHSSVEHHVRTGRRRGLLRAHESGSNYHRYTKDQAHTKSAVHHSFSSSLPNCCELFAAAIPAIPFFNRRSKIAKPCHRICSPTCTAAFTFSKNAVVSIILRISGTRRPLSAQSLLRQPHRLGQPVISNQQIHLDPFARALFIHRQAQCTERAALHPHAHNGCIVRFRRQDSRQQSEVIQLVVGHERLERIRFRGTLLRPDRIILQIRVARFRATVLRRRLGRLLRSAKMPRGFFLLALPPIAPAYRADQQRRRGQRPRRHHRHAPCFCRAVLHSEFLPQTHLNASGSLRRSSCLREGLQLHASRLPGILQRCAPRAHARVLTSCGALPFTQRSVALGVQSNGFKFLALHFALPFLFFIAPRSRPAERRAASRVSLAARRARGAAAIESFRSGIRRPAPLPRSSVLPARTAPPLREIPPATPAPRRELAPSAHAFPPKLLESSHPAKQFPRHSHPRFFAPKKRPARFLPPPTRFPSCAAQSGTSPPGAAGIEE